MEKHRLTIEGVYRDGQIELLSPLPPKGSFRVLVTFLEPFVQSGPISSLSHPRSTETVDEIEQANIQEPAILIRINRLYRPGISSEELYDITRGIWRVGERRDLAEYAFAVYNGVVREVYQIDCWYPAGTTKHLRSFSEFDKRDRWEFEGKVADEAVRKKYINKSVEGYFSRGSQNPILYVNC